MGTIPSRLAPAALLVLILAGGTPMSRALDQLEGATMRPVPVAPQRTTPRPEMIWVPDRYIQMPGAADTVHVPAHWERPLSPGEFHVPPLLVCEPATGACQLSPAGVRGPADQRPGP